MAWGAALTRYPIQELVMEKPRPSAESQLNCRIMAAEWPLARRTASSAEGRGKSIVPVWTLMIASRFESVGTGFESAAFSVLLDRMAGS